MSSNGFTDLTLHLDTYTTIAAVLLVFDFVLVQTHFWTLLKNDPSAKKTSIKALSFIAILVEFLVLTPLFFLRQLNAKSALILVLVPVGFILVNFLCFVISLVKTWRIHRRMVDEGRMVSYDTMLKVATAFIVISNVGSRLLGAIASILGFIGFCLYLHVLNKLRQYGAPAVVSRMFWAQIASIILGVITVIVFFVIALKIANTYVSNHNLHNGDQLPALTEDDVKNMWSSIRGLFVGLVVVSVIDKFLRLLSTGHYIGDSCNPQPYLNFEDSYAGNEDMESTPGYRAANVH